MLLPHLRASTSLRKWLIVSVAGSTLALCAAGIWYYEHHLRVTDAVLIGTWRFPPLGGDPIYFRLKADHTFRTFADDLSEEESPIKGSWFARGDFLYFRQPTFDREGFLTEHSLYIWRVESISANELHVRLNPDGIPRTVQRVVPDSPQRI
jgi:hypothetical protein